MRNFISVELLEEGVEGRDIGRDDPQQIIDRPAQAVELGDFREILHHIG